MRINRFVRRRDAGNPVPQPDGSIVFPLGARAAFKRKNPCTAVKETIDNIVFGSKKEANRYRELVLLMKAREISFLVTHTRHPLIVNGVTAGHYTDDFSYLDKGGKRVIEDVKGYKTRDYRFRKKVFEACSGLKITEI